MANAFNKEERGAMGRYADMNDIYGQDGLVYPHQLKRTRVTQYQAAPMTTAAAATADAAALAGESAPTSACFLIVIVTIAGLLVAAGVCAGVVLPTVFNMPATSSTGISSAPSTSPMTSMAVTTASPVSPSTAANVSDSATLITSTVVDSSASSYAATTANVTTP